MSNLMTRQEVEARFGLSRSSIYRLMRLGLFPEPIRIGVRAVRWNEADVRFVAGGVSAGDRCRHPAEPTTAAGDRPMRRYGRQPGRLPLAPDPRAPIRLTLPHWILRRVRAAARVEGVTEFAFVVGVLRTAVERPGALPDEHDRGH